LFISGHFPCFENVLIAAGHCKWLARRIGTGPSAELLKSCKNDTISVAFGLLRDWATKTGPMTEASVRSSLFCHPERKDPSKRNPEKDTASPHSIGFARRGLLFLVPTVSAQGLELDPKRNKKRNH